MRRPMRKLPSVLTVSVPNGNTVPNRAPTCVVTR